MGLLWVIYLFIYFFVCLCSSYPLFYNICRGGVLSFAFIHSHSFTLHNLSLPELLLSSFTPPTANQPYIGGGRSFIIAGILRGKPFFLATLFVSTSLHSSLISSLTFFQVFAALLYSDWFSGSSCARLLTSSFVFLSVLLIFVINLAPWFWILCRVLRDVTFKQCNGIGG